MQPVNVTTPFGRRTLTLAHVASQAISKARPPEKAVHKWHVYQAICAAKAPLGVTERALAVQVAGRRRSLGRASDCIVAVDCCTERWFG